MEEIQKVYIRRDGKSLLLFGVESVEIERVESSNIGESSDIRHD